MNRRLFFFLLSGEYETIPEAELRSALNVLDPDNRVKEVISHRILVAETTLEATREAVKRTAYTKLSGLFLGKAENKIESILRIIEEADLANLIPPHASTFAVRGKRIAGSRIDKLKLEKLIGEKILEIKPDLKVNLERPDVTIIFISSEKETILGRLIESKPKRFFANRIAGRRPFSLPSAMQPDFARAMINLAEVEPGGRILDPFAGTGGILIEAILLGYEACGVELKGWIAKGAVKNLTHYTRGSENMIVGDARKPMFREKSFDAIVTDPPYGRSTTVPEKSIELLLTEFLRACKPLLRGRGRVVIAAPSEIDMARIASKHGFNIRESHLARVHGSLVRRVVILEP